MMKGPIRIALVIAVLNGCVDPFETPEINSGGNILVVEGRIQDVFTSVKLSRTFDLKNEAFRPETDARVYLENESLSLEVQLNQIFEPGVYEVSQNLIFSDNYRIRIETADGNIYYSDFEELLETPQIQSIDVEFDSTTAQVNFLLNTSDPNNSTRYYRWDFVETWQYTSVINSRVEYIGGGDVQTRPIENKITNCWISNESSDIIIGTSVALANDIISKKLVYSVIAEENERFQIGYSLLMNQYAVTEREYQFWRLLEKNTETFGTLFDPQPSQLITNLRCVNNQGAKVIGFVGASSTSQERLFLKRDDFPESMDHFMNDRSTCPLNTADFNDEEYERLFGSNGDFIPVEFAATGFFITGVTYTSRRCADCRSAGGTLTRPTFWE